MGVADLPSVVCARFEFILPLPMVACVAMLGAAVLVSTWEVWEVPTWSGKVGHPDLLVSAGGVNSWM